MPNKQQTKRGAKGIKGKNFQRKSGGKIKHQKIHPLKPEPVKDIDKNGLVDRSSKTAYQIYNAGDPLLITTKTGKTLSERTSAKWSILAAARKNKGHLVLASKNQSQQRRYGVWAINARGIIQSRGRWLLGRALGYLGHEDIFGIDFNNDGVIGKL